MAEEPATIRPAIFVDQTGANDRAANVAVESDPEQERRLSNVDAAPHQTQTRSPGPLTVGAGWPEHPDSAEFSATEILGRLIRGTLTVLVLLGLALWGLRHWTRRNSGVAASSGSLNVIGSTTLSGRCQLQLVEADGHRVLVGLDAGGVKCVTVLPQVFAAELLAADAADDVATAVSEPNRFDHGKHRVAVAVGQPA